MDGDNRIERIVGLVLLAMLAVGCVLVLRPFFTAVCFALILVVATWPAFERLQRWFGGSRTSAALVMVVLAALVLVLPPALVASSIDYNVAGTVRLLRDLSHDGLPPPPAWVAEVKLIGPDIHARWQALASGGPEAAERIQAFIAWARLKLIDAGFGLGAAVVQLILAIVTAFFLYRDGVAVRRSLMSAGRRIAGDHAPRLLKVAYADHRRRRLRRARDHARPGAAAADRALDHRHTRGAATRAAAVPAVADPARAVADPRGRRRSGSISAATPDGRSSSSSGASPPASR